MTPSIWSDNLAEFREKVGGSDPLPAGVSISAVSASLALALLSKVLRITGARKDFAGDPDEIERLYEAARSESAELTRLADDDVGAFNRYLECVRGPEAPEREQAIAAAMREAIEVPLKGARSAARGLDLCAKAVALVHGLTAADLGIVAALLSGAVQAMLLSVEFNVKEIRADELFASAATDECEKLEVEALRRAEAVTASLNAFLG